MTFQEKNKKLKKGDKDKGRFNGRQCPLPPSTVAPGIWRRTAKKNGVIEKECGVRGKRKYHPEKRVLQQNNVEINVKKKKNNG